MDNKEILEKIRKKLTYIDGAMGTMLQKKGFRKGCPEELNINDPDMIRSIHKEYYEAGAQIIITNTFGANKYKLKNYNLQEKVIELNKAAVKIAREAAPKAIIAGDISELGEYVQPIGNLSFDDAYDAYKEQVKGLEDADVLIIETMSDIKALKAAIIAAKESGKVIITSMTFEDNRTTTGTDVKTYVKVVESLDVDIIGSNCSGGPDQLYDVAKDIVGNTNKLVMIEPNAGLPKLIDGKSVFVMKKEEFASSVKKIAKLGVNIVGGCCGTTPEYIKELVEQTKDIDVNRKRIEEKTCFCSRTRTVEIDSKTLIVGERINPSGRKDFREEIKEKKVNLIRKEAMIQSKEGASLLDINVGVPGTDEVEMIKKAMTEVQSIVDLPIVIDTSNYKALEEGLKMCAGKPLINSVNAEQKSIENVLPLAKKYGAGIICLCLDEKGIPKTKEERINIAKKLIKKATNIGIKKEDIVIDALTLTIATNPENENIILESIKELKKMGYKTILGVSNISFGLPNRSEINQKFFTKASKVGLNLAILNPKDNVYTEDTDISIEDKREEVNYKDMDEKEKLKNAIIYGDIENISDIIEDSLKEIKPLEINDHLLEGLDKVGKDFKAKKIFLPSVLRSAETMKKAFERVKKEIKNKDMKKEVKIIFATVENDIHDIGKNIVITILESHGYNVIDLGKNVSMEKIIKKALEENADIIALSALMTTTAPEMEKIVEELNKRNVKIPVIIGGAVITKDYAKDIGAAYSSNALDAVKAIKGLIKR